MGSGGGEEFVLPGPPSSVGVCGAAAVCSGAYLMTLCLTDVLRNIFCEVITVLG